MPDAPLRDETEAERADRNFGELLQELRVAQTGVQILFAFLLTIPVQSGYSRLDAWHRGVLVAALCFAGLAASCLIAPVAFHRILFRQRMKDQIVQAANRHAMAGLAFLLLSVVSSLLLVLDLILSSDLVAYLLVAALAVVYLALWLVLPLLRLRRLRVGEEQPGVT